MKRLSAILLAALLTACSQGGGGPQLTSAHSEASWLETCRIAPNAAGEYPAQCTAREVMWALTYLSEDTPERFIARLGSPNQGVRTEVTLAESIPRTGDDLTDVIVFVRGSASAVRASWGDTIVRIDNAEIIGVQTLIDGPKQGDAAAELTMAEFGRHCVEQDDLYFRDHCDGRRVVWYAIYQGPIEGGDQVFRLPFNDNRFAARMTPAEPLDWQVDPADLRGQLVVFEARITGGAINREGHVPYVQLDRGHIVNFSRVDRPVAAITGVE